MAAQNTTTSGIGMSGALFLIFLVLKLTEVIDWSWWWVTSPLWIPLALIIVIGGGGLLLIWSVDKLRKISNNKFR